MINPGNFADQLNCCIAHYFGNFNIFYKIEILLLFRFDLKLTIIAQKLHTCESIYCGVSVSHGHEVISRYFTLRCC